MSSPPVQYQGPAIDPTVPWDIRIHLTQIYQKLGNHYQGITLLNKKIGSVSATGGTSTTILESGGGGGGGSSPLPGLGYVNDQTGNTTYATTPGDNGVLLILNDASPIAVTLNTIAPPYMIFITNSGAGTATLTPSSGTINGSASVTLVTNQFMLAECNGTNWVSTSLIVPPQTFAAVTHEWVNSYTATTGLFTATQPAFTDISGSVAASQLPNPTTSALGGVEANTPVAHQWINAINTSGVPQLSQPAFTDISSTLATAQLPTAVPVVSFGTGAPSGSSTEGYLYFDTTLATYVGYVYHSGAWHQIQ
jgi:hypothetical protein